MPVETCTIQQRGCYENETPTVPPRVSQDRGRRGDYREVLARPDINAVIIATPDHWHSQIAIDAMKAGKDVYVEKPIVQHLDEGERVIECARQTNRILQVGSQRVSSIVYAKARDLFRAGAIGELNL